jgi:hypothetical protein
MQHRITWCYLCQCTEKLTNDHLPPKNLFPKPRPINLITVPCCASCNGGFSKLDEQFRVFVSMPLNVSLVGKEIMRKKVFGRSFKDSPRLKRQMARDAFKGTVTTALGPITVPLIAMDKDVIDRFLTRLTKGLLASFYSDVNYFNLQFAVTQLNQFGANHATFKAITSILTADERGDGVFRFWHGVAKEDRTTGIWIYQFYDAALFMVRHSRNLSCESEAFP